MATPSTVPAPIPSDASGSGRTVEIAAASAQEHEHHHALDAIPGKRASSSDAGDHDQAASGSGAGGGKLHVSRDLNAYRELPGLVSHFFRLSLRSTSAHTLRVISRGTTQRLTYLSLYTIGLRRLPQTQRSLRLAQQHHPARRCGPRALHMLRMPPTQDRVSDQQREGVGGRRTPRMEGQLPGGGARTLEAADARPAEEGGTEEGEDPRGGIDPEWGEKKRAYVFCADSDNGCGDCDLIGIGIGYRL
jgi:hypothetical protein